MSEWSARYLDDAHLRRERDIFAQTWHVACPASQLSAGTFRAVDLGHSTVIVSRDANGRVHAHHNTCPHRGNELVPDDTAGRGALRCSYHHWEFDLDGRCLAMPDEDRLPRGCRARTRLHGLRTATWAGLLWVCASQDAPELAEALGPATDWVAGYDLDNWAVAQHVRVDLDANWKCSVEVHNEGYHVHTLHEPFLPFVDDTSAQTDIDEAHGVARIQVSTGTPSKRLGPEVDLPAPLRQMHAALGVDPSLPSAERRDALIAALRANDTKGVWTPLTDGQLVDNHLIYVFPATHLNLHRDEGLVFLHRPHPKDPARCRFEQITIRRRVERANREPRTVDKDAEEIGPVTAADLHVAEGLQRGLGSGGRVMGPVHPDEAIIGMMHRRLADRSAR